MKMKKVVAAVIVALSLNAGAQTTIKYPFGAATASSPAITPGAAAQPIVIANELTVATFSVAIDVNKTLNVSYPSTNQYSKAYTPSLGNVLYILITANGGGETVTAGTGFTFDVITLTLSKTYLLSFVYTGSGYNLITSTLQN